MNFKLDSMQKITLGSILSIFGGFGMVFSILFGKSLLSNSVWVVGLFLLAVTAGIGVVLAVSGLYERRGSGSIEKISQTKR